jgi:hypothetical protein
VSCGQVDGASERVGPRSSGEKQVERQVRKNLNRMTYLGTSDLKLLPVAFDCGLAAAGHFL